MGRYYKLCLTCDVPGCVAEGQVGLGDLMTNVAPTTLAIQKMAAKRWTMQTLGGVLCCVCPAHSKTTERRTEHDDEKSEETA